MFSRAATAAEEEEKEEDEKKGKCKEREGDVARAWLLGLLVWCEPPPICEQVKSRTTMEQKEKKDGGKNIYIYIFFFFSIHFCALFFLIFW
mmetsp:Transcript_24713/g.37097  ORF Transcript_24713/g.37097 Transcript_24713/m.37097 type:complete len:91 (+) Transcript_24713:25-297(+)